MFSLNYDAPRATQPKGEGKVFFFNVQYKRRHLNMYIFSHTHYSDDYYYYCHYYYDYYCLDYC